MVKKCSTVKLIPHLKWLSVTQGLLHILTKIY